LKAALVIYGDLTSRSGGYLYDRMLVEHLERCGDSVEAVSVPGGPGARGVMSNADPRLLRRLGTLDADVLIEDELCHGSLFLLNRRLKETASFPLVGLVHHLSCHADPRPAAARRHWIAEKRFLSSLDGFLANSEATREAVRSLAPLARGAVARPGRDHVQARKVDRDMSGPLALLYVGNVLPHKGLETLVRAMASLPRGRARLEVVGPSPDRPFLHRVLGLVDRCGLSGEVRFRGWVSDEERDRSMDLAQVLVVPSRHEGYGLVFVEAMACGLPVIAPSSGGAGEIVTHGSEGFLVGPGDEGALASCLSKLEEDRDLLRTMSERARHRYDTLPTWEEQMTKAREHLLSFVG